MNDDTPLHLQTVRSQLAPLSALLNQRRELTIYFSDLAEEVGLEDRREQLQLALDEAKTQLASLDEELAALDEPAHQELVLCQKEIDKVIDAAKRAARTIGAEYLHDTNRLEASGVRLTISRVATHVEYLPEMLAELPGLEAMEVDGDPVVEKRLNGALIDRLVTRNVIPEGVAKKFRLVVKEKNPTVRAEFLDVEA